MAVAVAEDAGPFPWLTNDNIKALVAEVVGTFVFVFLGAGSIITAHLVGGPNELQLLLAAFGNGLGLGLAITIFGHVSGGHLNPAVTISLWVSQRIASLLAILYIIAQVVGALLASMALKWIFSYSAWFPTNLGAPHLSTINHVQFGTGVLLEAIMTFFLVLAVFGTAVDPRHPQVGGFAIGLIVFLDVLVGGPLTGAAMNPARALGPEIAGNFYDNPLVFWIGPILGGIIASLIYGYVLMPHQDIDIASAPAVPGSDILPVPAPETNPALDETVETAPSE